MRRLLLLEAFGRSPPRESGGRSSSATRSSGSSNAFRSSSLAMCRTLPLDAMGRAPLRESEGRSSRTTRSRGSFRIMRSASLATLRSPPLDALGRSAPREALGRSLPRESSGRSCCRERALLSRNGVPTRSPNPSSCSKVCGVQSRLVRAVVETRANRHCYAHTGGAARTIPSEPSSESSRSMTSAREPESCRSVIVGGASISLPKSG